VAEPALPVLAALAAAAALVLGFLKTYLGSLVGYRLNARLLRRAVGLTLIAVAIAGGVKLLLG
jgi:uncharacterized membrane protein YfcA